MRLDANSQIGNLALDRVTGSIHGCTLTSAPGFSGPSPRPNGTEANLALNWPGGEVTVRMIFPAPPFLADQMRRQAASIVSLQAKLRTAGGANENFSSRPDMPGILHRSRTRRAYWI